MSEVPMEYKVMKKKFSKSLQKVLGSDLVGVIVYGGAASDRVFSGVSDVDFFIILKPIDELEKPLSEIYSILGSEVVSMLDNPLFASLLDYEIYLADQLPKNGDLNGFSAIRALALSQGETLVGENPFDGQEISKEDLIRGARRMLQEYIEKLTSYLFMPDFDSLLEEEGEGPNMDAKEEMEAEKEFLALDAVLSAVQAYQMITRSEYVSMPDVVLFAETDPIDGLDNELIKKVGLLRQGVEADVDDIYNKAIDFCGNVIKAINNF